MVSVTANRIARFGFWVAGAVSAELTLSLVLAWLNRGDGYGFSTNLWISQVVAVGSVLCGMVGYAVAAALSPSSASYRDALVSGAVATLLTCAALQVLTAFDLQDSLALALFGAFCVALGALSYLFTRGNAV